MRRVLIPVFIILSLSAGSCTGGNAGGDTNITCFNNQPVQVVLPSGQFPVIQGDGSVVGDIENPDGTHTFTVSGCDFTITGDTSINTDSHNSQDNNDNNSFGVQ